MKRTPTSRPVRAQRGAATLIVVMVLFFVISLVAAYTNRNLIFEQRTSANQYRSTQALEAAEAGIDWALAMLNHGQINADCEPYTTPSVSDDSFRERYLTIDWTNGKYTHRTDSGGAVLLPTCVYNGTDWNCACPTTGGPPALAMPPGATTAVYPAFRVRLERITPLSPAAPSQPGVIWVQAVGCTRLDPVCLAFNSQGTINEGRSVVSVLVSLTGTASPPLASVTAYGDITITPGGHLRAYNTSTSSGIAIHSGGTQNGTITVQTAAGSLPTPGPLSNATVAGDTAMQAPGLGSFTDADRMFAGIFNMKPATFMQQPAAVEIICTGGPCTAQRIRDAVALNPGRPIRVHGSLDVDSAGDIGTAAAPVLLVIEGDLGFSVPGTTIYGLAYLYSPTTTTTATLSGSGSIQGALVAGGNIAGNPTLTVAYDADVLKRLRIGTGSLVRVPGSWKDFQ